PVSAAGTPSTENSHGSTVEAFTAWSPDDWSALANTWRSPFGATSALTSDGISSSDSGFRRSSAEYSLSVWVMSWLGSRWAGAGPSWHAGLSPAACTPGCDRVAGVRPAGPNAC